MIRCVYLGQHKCGSTWVWRLLRDFATSAGLDYAQHYLPDRLPFDFHLVEPFAQHCRSALEFIARSPAPVLAHGNAYPLLVQRLRDNGRPLKAFHVIRDPRDVIVSGYFSHRDTHRVSPDFNPWMIRQRERLRAVSQAEGLLLEIDYAASYFARLRGLLAVVPDKLTVRLESLGARPDEEWWRILTWVGLANIGGLSADFVAKTLQAQSFAVLQKSDPGHYRSGRHGDWQRYFTREAAERFIAAYPGLLEELGYDSGDGWVLDCKP